MLTKQRKQSTTEKLVLTGILTALVIVLQLLCNFVKVGPFAITLVLIPIVIGAATCGPWAGAWLGFVFGFVACFDPGAAAFYAINIFGTIATVILKGTLCGLAAGFAYKLVERWNKYAAVAVAAVVSPVVNTGVFFLGCLAFFFRDIKSWGAEAGYENALIYIILAMIGVNFLIELGTNIVLSPVVVRLLNIRKKKS